MSTHLEASDTRASIERFVHDTLVDYGAEPTSVSNDATLDDIGIDSLDLVELGQSIKKNFGIHIKPKDFAEVTTVGQALDVIYVVAGLR